MTVRPLVFHPDPVLRNGTKKVTQFDDALQELIDDMFETMYEARGVGLAAPQIGVDLAITVIDTSNDKSEQLVLINPEIIEVQNQQLTEEGCLSVPGGYERVLRGTYAKARALDRHGKPFEVEGYGLLAQALQHEIDHLNGTLYIDKLSSIKRARALRRLNQYKRKNG